MILSVPPSTTLGGANKLQEPFQYLLNIHWCWIQPLFNFIYRPAFTRMSKGFPLNVVEYSITNREK